MKKLNKWALTTGTLLSIASPAAFVIACGGTSEKPPEDNIPEETGLEPRFYTFDIDGVQHDQESHILASYGIDPMPNPTYTWRAWDEGSQTDFDSTTHPDALKITTNRDLFNAGQYVTTFSLVSPFTGVESHVSNNFNLNTTVLDPLDPVKIYKEKTTLNVAVVYTSFSDTYNPGPYEDTMKYVVDQGVEMLENATGNHIDFDLDIFDQGQLQHTTADMQAKGDAELPYPEDGASNPANIDAHTWASEQLFMQNDMSAITDNWDKYDIVLGTYKSKSASGELYSMAAGNVQHWNIFKQEQYAENIATIGQYAPNIPGNNKKFVSVGIHDVSIEDSKQSAAAVDSPIADQYGDTAGLFAHELGHAAGLAGHSGSLLSATNQDAFVAAGTYPTKDQVDFTEVDIEYGDKLSFMGDAANSISAGISPVHEEIIGDSSPSVTMRATESVGDLTIPEYGYAKIHLGTEQHSKTDFKNHSLYVAYLSDAPLSNGTLVSHTDNVNGLYMWYGGLSNNNTIGESIQISPYTEANLISFQPGESFSLLGTKVTVNTVAGAEATITVEEDSTTDVLAPTTSFSSASQRMSGLEDVTSALINTGDSAFVKDFSCWHCTVLAYSSDDELEDTSLNVVTSITEDSLTSPPA